MLKHVAKIQDLCLSIEHDVNENFSIIIIPMSIAFLPEEEITVAFKKFIPDNVND